MTIWEEQQRKWDRIQKGLSNKIYNGQAFNNKELLMESIDICRPKVEEYDSLLAARPLRERFWAETWAPSLRNGLGGRFATVGNIYSGLECETEKPIHPPSIVRKPHSIVQNRIGSNINI